MTRPALPRRRSERDLCATFALRLLCLATLGCPALSAQAQQLTPEIVVDLRTVEDVGLSPDGREVLYRLDRRRTLDEGVGKRIGEIWHTTHDSRSRERKLALSGIDARAPQWSPSGDRIAWLARPKLGDPEQLYISRPDGRNATKLTEAASGVSAFKWAPDATRIAYVVVDASSSSELDDQRAGRDWTVFEQPTKHARLYLLDVRSQLSRLVTRDDLSVHFFSWSPDGERFVVAAAPSLTSDDRFLQIHPYVVPAAGGALRRLAGTVGKLTDAVWSNDGKWIAWLASVETWDPHAGSVFVVPSDGGEVRNLTPDFIGSATTLAALPGTPQSFVFRSEEFQGTVLRTVNAATGELGALAAPQEALVGAPSFAADGRRFATAASAATHPAELFIGETGTLRRVTRTNTSLEGIELGTQEVARWRSVDGTTIEGVLIKPPGFDVRRRYPLVLHVHGGSESVVSNGWQGTHNNLGQLLAARGYVVLYPNYRGSRGRGVAFVSGNRRDVMGREWEDTERGLDHLIELGIADPARVGIYGFSWGGYAAGWGATYATHRFKAAVAGAGFFNWISEAGTEEARVHEQVGHWDLPMYENFELYLSRSPLYHVRKAQTPVLLLHGEKDDSCPLSQAVEFHTALKWKGVPVELVVYPREGHGMVEYEHALDFTRRGLAWFDRYLQPR